MDQHGRYRTNIWNYKGMNAFGSGRHDEFALHPTVKPVAMIADAIKDVSNRNAIVLDLFGGSGSTLIAANQTSRRGYLCELDPVYCDRIICRWQRFAKDDAILEATGESFEDVVQGCRGESRRSAFDCHDAVANGVIGSTGTVDQLLGEVRTGCGHGTLGCSSLRKDRDPTSALIGERRIAVDPSLSRNLTV